MKEKFLLVFVLMFAVSMTLFTFVRAQEDTSSTETVVTSSTEVEELDGIEVKDVDKVPSAFGLFWLGLKERVNIALTLDPVKKAEKQVKYAEQRIKLAEKIAENSDDPNVQEKVQSMIDRAQELMAKIEERKDTLLANPDERAQRLFKNIATHQENKETLLDKIETHLQDKLTPEQLQKFEDLRQSGLGKAQGILRALENPNMPEDVKDKLQEVKDRIDIKATEMAEFRGEQKQILEDIKNGVDGAKDALKDLRESRQEEIKTNLEEVKTKLEDRKDVELKLREDAMDGDVEARQRLETMRKIDAQVKENVQDRMENRQEIREDIRDAVNSSTKQLPVRPLQVQMSY